MSRDGRRRGFRALGLLACVAAASGCGYIVTPEDLATPTPAIAGGDWTVLATKVEPTADGSHVDLAVRNDTGEWSALGLADGGTVSLVDASGAATPCATAFVGTGEQSLAPGLTIRGYTAGTRFKPVMQPLFVECAGAAPGAGATLRIDAQYTTGDFNYYRPAAPRGVTLSVALDAPAGDLAAPGSPAPQLAVARVGEPIDAINQNTLTLTSVTRTADGLELAWHTENPTKYPVYVHIGIPPVVGGDGMLYGKYQSPNLADTPITPAKATADWTTKVTMPAGVQALFVLPAVETEQQKNFRSHAIDISDQ